MLSVNASRRFDQQQLLESLRHYDPWGRAGGGAPTSDVRRKDLLSRNIFPQPPQLWRDSRDRMPPSLRLRHRPRRSFMAVDLMRHPNDFPKEPHDCVKYYQEGKQEDPENKFPQVINGNKVWSSDPWDGRGPWGSRCPGGRPWRPAGHVGRNFHHSMGWTTENTFHFPSINNMPKYNFNKENIVDVTMRQMNGFKKPLKLKDRKKKMAFHKMPPIRRSSMENGNDLGNVDEAPHGVSQWEHGRQTGCSFEERCAGSTPTRQLLQMTGGIELVPLMRARAWTYKQKPLNIDHLTSIMNNPQGVFH